MKKFRKIMAVLVAAIMVVAMTVPAWAAAADYKIVISNAINGETYSAYKIFDAPQKASETMVFVQVPLSTIKLDANRDIQYYSDTSGTVISKADYQTYNGAVYEQVKKYVSYTIDSTKNGWFNKINEEYAGDTNNKGLTLTPTVGNSSVYLVEFTPNKFDAADFAQFLKAYIDPMDSSTRTSNKLIAADSKTVSSNTTDLQADGDNVTSTTLNVGIVGTTETPVANDEYKGAGYYFVDTSIGALCILDTTTTTANVKEKNVAPTEEKVVWNSDLGTSSASGSWTTYDEAQIGDTVYFKLTVKDGIGTDSAITVYDELSAGLTWSESVSVYQKVLNPINEDKAKYWDLSGKTPVQPGASLGVGPYYTVVDAAKYELKIEGFTSVTDVAGNSFDPDFAVILKDNYVDTLGKTDEVVIYYSATLNTSAEMFDTANTNKTFLAYEKQKTPVITRDVYTYDTQIVKYDKDDNKMLAAATFEIYRKKDFTWTAGAVSGTKMNFTNTSGSTYRVATAGGSPTLTSSASVPITLEGLDADTYYLVETKAPDGYNALKAPIEFTVSKGTDKAALSIKSGIRGSDGTLSWSDATSADGDATTSAGTWTSGGVSIANTAGTELPSTGGMGTTVLYIVGGMLVILAGAYLFFSRKKTA